MLNETHHAPPRYKIPEFFSSLLDPLTSFLSNLTVFSYDVSGDGQRFLIATKVDEVNAAPLSILLNWASQMEK